VLVAGATLAAAALFNPLRRYVQARVDRRFNRSRYDAQQEIEGLAELLRSSVGLEDVKSEVVGLVTRTMQPVSISIWSKTPHQRRRRLVALGGDSLARPEGLEPPTS
jgi:hypothetical protein